MEVFGVRQVTKT